MVVEGVVLESFVCVAVKHLPVEVTDEAEILDVFVSLGLEVSQLCEGVNDNPEDDVQQNCNQNQEETQVVAGSEVEALQIHVHGRLSGQEVTNSSSSSEPVVDGGHEAVKHALADGVAFAVEPPAQHVVVVEGVVHEDEADGRVDVDNDEPKHGRHEKLVAVECDRRNNVLQLRESVDHVQKMERVEDGRLEQPLEGESHVDQDENEATILHQEAQPNPLLLELQGQEPVVLFAVLVVEGLVEGTLRVQQDTPGFQGQV
mmetsp:Transcript_6821/g.10995  ORF Transcript_6821/g.10995 Transcript_6821/m.10995 type:complete len:259 (-) Transcript_6821:7817-8593(-)